MKWANEQGYSRAWVEKYWKSGYLKISPCSVAAKYGHLSCLKWLRKNGCDWNAGTCSSAAGNGHLSCLKWARENGCDWDKWTYIGAQRSLNTDVLNFVIDQGCPRRWEAKTNKILNKFFQDNFYFSNFFLADFLGYYFQFVFSVILKLHILMQLYHVILVHFHNHYSKNKNEQSCKIDS